MRFRPVLSALLLSVCGVLSATGAVIDPPSSGTLSLDWTNRGWVGSDGSQALNNGGNYYAGDYLGVNYRNFFVFNLGDLPPAATVTSATLSINSAGTSPGTVHLDVWLFGGDPDVFVPGDPGVAVFDSMITGPLLQSFGVDQDLVVYDISLAEAFRQAIEAAAGDFLAFTMNTNPEASGVFAFSSSFNTQSILHIDWAILPPVETNPDSGAGTGPAAAVAAANRRVTHQQMQAQQAAARRVAYQQRMAQHRRSQQR